MARTIAEIKKSMTDRFMRDAALREAYGITGDATWENTFSTVSVENIQMYIVAACAYGLEVLFDAFRGDVDERVAANIVPTVRWYHTQALAWQYGDQLVYDEEKQLFRYAEDKPEQRIVKYCAVRDEGNTLEILAAKDEGGKPAVLSSAELSAFKAYMNQIKIAGIMLNIRSLAADSVRVTAKVYVDPQLITATGQRTGAGDYPVREAIDAYLANIVYGGTFNKTRCVDAIQAVDGVLDVELGEVKAKKNGGDYATVQGNNYTAVSGCMVSDGLNATITYVVQDGY